MSQAKPAYKKDISFFDNEFHTKDDSLTFLKKVNQYKKTLIVLGVLLFFVLGVVMFSSGKNNSTKVVENQPDIADVLAPFYMVGYFPSNEDYEKEWLEMQNGKESFHIPGTGQQIVNKRLDSNLDTAKGHRERVLDEVEEAWRKIAKSEQIIIKMNDMQQTQLEVKK